VVAGDSCSSLWGESFTSEPPGDGAGGTIAHEEAGADASDTSEAGERDADDASLATLDRGLPEAGGDSGPDVSAHDAAVPRDAEAGATLDGRIVDAEAGATLDARIVDAARDGESSEASLRRDAALLGCSGVAQGKAFADHCYVDITQQSVTQPEAAAACAAYAAPVGRKAYLLNIDSQQEQDFILQQFLATFVDRGDAWLALTCSESVHADGADCACMNCDAAVLLQKRANWSWSTGSTARFGWTLPNPNGAGRCAALGYNPSTAQWSWVDRQCLDTSFRLSSWDGGLHSYRVLCEVE
jgi:hypothetical protein